MSLQLTLLTKDEWLNPNIEEREKLIQERLKNNPPHNMTKAERLAEVDAILAQSLADRQTRS